MLEEDYQRRGPQQELGLCMGSGEGPCTKWSDSHLSQEDKFTPHWLRWAGQQCMQRTQC